MVIPAEIETEWRERHGLSRASLQSLHDVGDVDDTHPICTAIAMLRAHALSAPMAQT